MAVLSSMNFYSGSAGGASWEAGLVSIEKIVVESIADSILGLLEKPESKEFVQCGHRKKGKMWETSPEFLT